MIRFLSVFIVMGCISLYSLSPRSKLYQKLFQCQSRSDLCLTLKGFVEKGDRDSLHIFYKHDLQKFSSFYSEILAYAISCDQLSVVQFFLECGDNDVSMEVLIDILWRAYLAGHRELIDTIIDKYPALNVQRGGDHLLVDIVWMALDVKNVEIFEAIIDRYPDAMIQFFLECGDYDMSMEVLVDIIWRAYQFGYKDLIDTIIDKYPALKVQRGSDHLLVDIVWMALEVKSVDVFESIVDRYPSLIIPGSSFFHIAVQWRDVDLLRKVCQCCKNINVKDFQGQTPLHYAVSESISHFVEILCRNGADIDAEDDDGITPWDMAREDKKVNILFDMLHHQNGVHASYVQALFDLAAQSGSLWVVYRLLMGYSAYININEQDENGRTALHYLIEYRGLELLPRFMNIGASFHIKDRNGETPLHLAIKQKLVLKIFDIDECPFDKMKEFSYIRLVLECDQYELFIKLFPFLDLNQQSHVSTLIRIAVRRGHYLVLKTFLYPYIPVDDREELLKEALKNSSSEHMARAFVAFCALGKVGTDVWKDIVSLRPEIIQSMNFASPYWKAEDKMKFLNFLVKERPGEPLVLFSEENVEGWSRVSDFLEILLESPLPIKSLKCSLSGTALSALINQRCVANNRKSIHDNIILKMIERGIDVNEDTPIGRAVGSLYLYAFYSYRWFIRR